ncbi:hypothetical protein HBN50_15585 [Halobacteriovorax sp. GB3]|uniref:hypothetical protein n=1 Tax=Halobacteriovorax sp. GB3 TaxID=2719615 RepID=UPI00236123DE|nr:hypothetical protein [Halobacteriovorax sp. GB3]MDD0854533.1 hypothetical protein [Halobacteriovorax sp. GB3]
MENASVIKLNESDFEEFRQWIKLNLESVTWQGRFKSQFEEFWQTFFAGDMTISEIIERFNYSCSILKVGPLISWFNWLKEKFICFCFVEKKLTILELSKQSKMAPSVVGVILRNYFVDIAPHKEEYFSEVFQIGNLGSHNLSLTFADIQEAIHFETFDVGSYVEEIMPSLEVTLYEDWSNFVARLKKDFSHGDKGLKKIESKDRLIGKLKIVKEAIALILFCLLAVWAVTAINNWYEDYLADKISVYEPQFKWLDKTLSFKSVDDLKVDSNFKLDISDIENVAEFENQLGETLDDVERTEVESEVVLTSWDSLPKDIDTADLEQSDYEEVKKRGYRDSRYGNTKVYRILMRSSDATTAKNGLSKLIDKYDVKQVDNVKPGIAVPGGFYYNLYVPRTYLKEFMAEVEEVDAAVIYESRTRTRRNPPGKNKVFIWVKSM